MSAAPVTFAMAEQVLAAQPFSALLGAQLTEFAAGSATLEVEIDDRHRQQFGLVHGGVLSYAADNVLTFAGGSVLGASVVTGQMTINYLAGARNGVLRARGTVVHQDARQAVCTATLHMVGPREREKLCAIAQGTILRTGGHEPVQG